MNNEDTPAQQLNNYRFQPIPNMTDEQANEIYRRADYQKLPDDIKGQVLGRMCFIQQKYNSK